MSHGNRDLVETSDRQHRSPEAEIGSYCFSLMAAFTFAAISGGMAIILWAVLACSAPLAITSASSFPSMTALQPGIKSPHLSTFAMVALPPILLRRDWSVTSAPTGHKAHGAAERSLGIVRGTVNLNGFFMSSPSMWSRDRCWPNAAAIFRQPSILRNLISPLATRLKSRTNAASSLGSEPRVFTRRRNSSWSRSVVFVVPL